MQFMNNNIATVNTKKIGKFTPEQIELIKATVAKGATDDELQLFMAVANRSGLDVFTRQLFFIKRRTWNKDKKAYEEVGSIQTGIDGYRAIAARTGEHAGTDDAVIEEKDGVPVKATVTVYRMIGGEPRAFTASARFSEYAQKYDDKLTGQWAKMPFLMISKVAEALALRKAFSNVLSDLYTHEEMAQADSVAPSKKTKSVEPANVVATIPADEKPKTNTAKNRIVLMMKSHGLAPTTNTSEAWAEAVKNALGMELAEENYEKIIEALEAANEVKE